MNVFEDLIVELKQENLLERTVTEEQESPEVEPEVITVQRGIMPAKTRPDELAFAYAQLDFSEPELETEAEHASTDAVAFVAEAVTEGKISAADLPKDPPSELPVRPSNGKEFYRKRAVGELSNLQTVEHVVTGVEREYLKIVPKSFDDFNAKKALNSFLQITEGENSPEHAEAEFALMRETEAWCTRLAERDRNIPVSAIRRYCENSRPALSSQALVSLARFYRNLPYTEAVRGKFDFVITRVFTKTLEDHQRVTMFSREEMLDRINMLYREWSSIPLYTADADESNVMLTALSFEELAMEAESASSFDLLISSDFFGRMRMFKESISELFYAPNVTAAAVECNVRVGNAYVNLIDREREQSDAKSFKEKYGELDELVISDATSKTLTIGEFLQKAGADVSPAAAVPTVAEPVTTAPSETSDDKKTAKKGETYVPFYKRLDLTSLRLDPRIAIISFVLIAVSIGIYFWAGEAEKEPVTKTGVIVLSIEGTFMKEHLNAARISGETIYGMLEPSWNTLSKEKREEFLKAMMEVAKEKGCSQVNLINREGKAAGYISATRMDMSMP